MSESAANKQDTVKTVYLDRNVISYMFNTEAQSPPVLASRCMREVLMTPFGRESYRCPYSIAHFEEIHTGGAQYVLRDIQALGILTEDWCISESIAGEVSLERRPTGQHYEMWAWQKTDPEAVQAMVLRELESMPDPVLKEFVSSQTTALNQIKAESDAALLPINESIRSLQSTVKDMFDAYADLATDPTLAGVLRDLGNAQISMNGEEIKTINRRIRNYTDQNKLLAMPNVSRTELSKDSARFRAVVDRVLKHSNYPYNSASEFFEFLPIKDGVFPPFKTKVLQLSALSDHLRTTIERKETSWQSAQNDLLHLSLSLRCDIFVSSDMVLLDRALFIKRWLDLPVLILNPAECVQYMLQERLLSVDPEHRNREVVFEFKDAAGMHLGKFKVAV